MVFVLSDGMNGFVCLGQNPNDHFIHLFVICHASVRSLRSVVGHAVAYDMDRACMIFAEQPAVGNGIGGLVGCAWAHFCISAGLLRFPAAGGRTAGFIHNTTMVKGLN